MTRDSTVLQAGILTQNQLDMLFDTRPPTALTASLSSVLSHSSPAFL